MNFLVGAGNVNYANLKSTLAAEVRPEDSRHRSKETRLSGPLIQSVSEDRMLRLADVISGTQE